MGDVLYIDFRHKQKTETVTVATQKAEKLKLNPKTKKQPQPYSPNHPMPKQQPEQLKPLIPQMEKGEHSEEPRPTLYDRYHRLIIRFADAIVPAAVSKNSATPSVP